MAKNPANYGKKWTAAQITRLEKLVNEGKSGAQIAKILKRPIGSVYCMIHENHLRIKVSGRIPGNKK